MDESGFEYFQNHILFKKETNFLFASSHVIFTTGFVSSNWLTNISTYEWALIFLLVSSLYIFKAGTGYPSSISLAAVK